LRLMNRSTTRWALVLVVIALTLIRAAPAWAQTDYYNTDKGRPLQTEDAYPVERRAVEIQAAPLRLERLAAGVYQWSVEPEIAFGVLPRMQVELGVPISLIDAAGARSSGLNGLDFSVFYNLNVETSLPAFAISVSALLPVGALAPDNPYFVFKGIATRTLSWARFHVNGEYTAGHAASASGTFQTEVTRWSTGLGIDRTFPLQSLLVGGEVVLQQPIDSAADLAVAIGVGTRYQLAPRWAIDGGIGKRLTGDDRGWYVTLGSAYAFGLPWYPRGQR
jgi:hypothetical protein